MIALPPLPEPFDSFPHLPLIALPNHSKGVPGVTFARESRMAGNQAAGNAPLGAVTPPFPFPYPPRCLSPVTALIRPGSPAHTLACAYWAYGWCEGMLHEIEMADPGDPRALAAKHAVWTLRFPNPEFDQWEPQSGGLAPKPWDTQALRCMSPVTLYGPPRWAEWFLEYRKNGFTAPTCYWDNK